MKTLALEFSTDQRSVAVLDGDVCRGTAVETATRETHAIALITQALASAGLEREDIELVAVGLGPGSYTGIRSAIALAQGWQLAGGKAAVRLAGCSSVECLAREAWQKGWWGKVNVVVDAQRQEIYLAGYEIHAGGVRLTRPLRIASLADARGLAEAGEIMVGPEIGLWFPAGRMLFPTAATLGGLAARAGHFVAGEELTPLYLRETSFVKAPPLRELPVELRAPVELETSPNKPL